MSARVASLVLGSVQVDCSFYGSYIEDPAFPDFLIPVAQDSLSNYQQKAKPLFGWLRRVS